MANIKIEVQEQPLPAIVATTEWSDAENNSDCAVAMSKEWDANMELALLNAIARCKPVGIHKHFRIMSVRRQFNQHSHVSCTIKQIWDRLSNYYGMEALDELEEEDEKEQGGENRVGDQRHEFSLPLDDYEQLISEHRQDDQSHYEEPSSPPSKRTRTSKREESPTTSVAESITSTPEPEDGKSKRSSRGTRKSDATPEPMLSRSRSVRKTARSTNRGSTRTKKK